MTREEFGKKIDGISSSYWYNTNGERENRIKFHIESGYDQGYEQAINDACEVIHDLPIDISEFKKRMTEKLYGITLAEGSEL